MHICVHDFAGHPFTVELSRALAARGHRVSHVWFAQDSGPKGRMTRQPDDPEGLALLPLGRDIPYSKTDFRRRRAGDIRYGKELGGWIAREKPDVLISGNTPTEAQEGIVAACAAAGVPFLYWCQDFYSIAVSRLLQKKLPGPGHLVGAYYRFLERRQMHRAARVVHITEGFRGQTDRWGIPRDKVEVIPNWGALDEIAVMGRDTPWAAEQGLAAPEGQGDGQDEGQGAATRFLYSGTLALKHNPELLAALARALGGDERLVLVSAGVGADRLAAEAGAGALPRLVPLPLQPFERFSEVLASGDVLLGVIERDAGEFSVPSKILSYLCAARPVVLAAPKENLAARILTSTGAGKVVEPEDTEGFVAAALAFRDDPAACAAAGAAGRAYAETHFDLEKVAIRFETLFEEARGAARA